MENNRRVVITGIGVIAPNGIGKDAFWDALKNGRTGIRKITYFDSSVFPFHVAGEIPDFDPKAFMPFKSCFQNRSFYAFCDSCHKYGLKGC